MAIPFASGYYYSILRPSIKHTHMDLEVINDFIAHTLLQSSVIGVLYLICICLR